MAMAFYIVDAFATAPFNGNPAAVCLFDSSSIAEMGENQTTQWMQNVAAEMNLSETAFLNLETNQLRWFTPRSEVDLCGHATIATTKALVDAGKLSIGNSATFQTRSGPLSVEVLEPISGPRAGSLIQLDFPATPPVKVSESEASQIRMLFENAKIDSKPDDLVGFIGKSRFDILVEMPSEKSVEDLVLDFELLKSMPFRGLMVTAASSCNEYDFVSRFFAPSVGVNEDPVTGSAHCCLAPYWSEKLSKRALNAKQLSERGGELAIEMHGERVKLAGQAFTVVVGTLTI